MTKVKGSPQFHMKVVPHRPLRKLLIALLLCALVVGLTLGAYEYAGYKAQQQGVSADAAAELKAARDQLEAEVQGLRQQLTQAQLNAEVDRKASEDLRQRLFERREQIAQLERDISVYRMMSARTGNNPQGIGFGAFSVKAQGERVYHIKLVVQKLAEGESEYAGVLEANLIGKQDGEDAKYPLAQLAVPAEGVAPLGEKIPVEFKYFQTIETDVLLPQGFDPTRLDVRLVSNAKQNPLVLTQALEWVSAED